ncbi:MAG: 23S rRNA (adenine(2503)-C(2))-methyltransferase RlmN [Treponema sp.]|uniref:23S rRNA (adenine(2503)-C(2))-methyltransferase RlmN n=1 Tax=Treponema sp. TaxID=166 RepID=UPI001B6CB966|nr:23S rRNA (adenine(2503)-C(2))-methyltransferase RlmN [Treponema sp.]MBP3773376.1 23S rRNA (adenine(2503)-C(2))-methyltransferase RlmN [Treponema sp.]MBQ9281093.1 23S rRNA (adenine(2503)-C(2))-methyltransferase RlmN [Treponema sp.]
MAEVEKIALAGLLPEEITESLSLKQAFRGKQIFQWIGKGAESFDEMTNLSKDLRDNLSEKALLRSTLVSKILEDSDGTIKLQITLSDGLAVETVLLTDRESRKTACVSCQVGCAMNCAFCQTGHLGLARNLTAGEIVEQFLYLEKHAGPLDNIVFMGMGEPMMNLENVRKAIAILTNKEGRALSGRRITLSTSGVIKGIYDLADNGPQIRLAVSLTTADSVLRERLMPICRTNPLSELRKAIDYFARKTGKRVTLEAALLHDTNTSIESATNMINFARGLDVHVNLIPWNPVDGLEFSEPSAKECKNFLYHLEKAGINVTLRTRRGREIGGACGQLGKTLVSTQGNGKKLPE